MFPQNYYTSKLLKMKVFNNPNRVKKFTISYQQREVDKIIMMENHLMEFFGYNRSQLHKELIREKYKQQLGVL